MKQSSDCVKENTSRGKKRLKKTIVLASTLIFVIAVTVSLQLVYGRHPERLLELRSYVYWGAFLISLIGNATIIFPGAVLIILTNMGIVLYPVTGVFGLVMVGLVGAVGAAIGEITGYLLGYGGRGVVENSRLYLRLVAWVRRWGMLAVFLLSVVPLFFDLVGIAAGVLRFPLWKFMLLCWLGRTVLYVGMGLAGAFGYQSILPYFT